MAPMRKDIVMPGPGEGEKPSSKSGNDKVGHSYPPTSHIYMELSRNPSYTHSEGGSEEGVSVR